MLSGAYCDHMSKVPFANDYKIKIISCCYQWVNVIKNDWFPKCSISLTYNKFGRKKRSRLLLNFMHRPHTGGSKCHQQFVSSQLFIGLMHSLAHSLFSKICHDADKLEFEQGRNRVMFEMGKG